MSDPRIVIECWKADTLGKAKKLIYDPDRWTGALGGSWERRTEDVIPVLLDETVLNALPGLGNRVALEIGCGVGRLLVPMAERFAYVIGIDVTPSMVDLSREYLGGAKHVSVLLCDGRSIPAPPQSIDFVYSMITFQHIPYRDAIRNYLLETRRVLRPGGVVRIQTLRGEGTDAFNGTQGYWYPSAEAFAGEFTDAGLTVLDARRGIWHEEFLWVTAIKEGNECQKFLSQCAPTGAPPCYAGRSSP